MQKQHHKLFHKSLFKVQMIWNTSEEVVYNKNCLFTFPLLFYFYVWLSSSLLTNIKNSGGGGGGTGGPGVHNHEVKRIFQ